MLHASTSALTFAGEGARATRVDSADFLPVLGMLLSFVSEFACLWLSRKFQYRDKAVFANFGFAGRRRALIGSENPHFCQKRRNGHPRRVKGRFPQGLKPIGIVAV